MKHQIVALLRAQIICWVMGLLLVGCGARRGSGGLSDPAAEPAEPSTAAESELTHSQVQEPQGPDAGGGIDEETESVGVAPAGLDVEILDSVRERYGHLLISPAVEDTTRTIFEWGRERLETAEGVWARLHPGDGDLPADPDSTFLVDQMRGLEHLDAAETRDDERAMIHDFQAARAAFEAVLEKDARNQDARDHLVLSLERLAETYESADLYQKALALYDGLIAHEDRSNWYYHYRRMLVLDRLGRAYAALESGYLAEDLLLQLFAGRLPKPLGSKLTRDDARSVRRTILRRRWSTQQELGLFDALLITANRLEWVLPAQDRRHGSPLTQEFELAMAWDPQGMGQSGFYRHLNLVRAYNSGGFQQAYAGWQELLDEADDEDVRLVLDYYLALVERRHLAMEDQALRRQHGWWARYRDRQLELAERGARYLTNDDIADGAYLLEDFGSACEARGRALLNVDRVEALAYFEQSSAVLWSQRAAAALNAAALLPPDIAEAHLLRARHFLILDLDPERPTGRAPLASRHITDLRRLAPRIYENLLHLARRSGRHAWIDPLRAELAEIQERGFTRPGFHPPVPEAVQDEF